ATEPCWGDTIDTIGAEDDWFPPLQSRRNFTAPSPKGNAAGRTAGPLVDAWHAWLAAAVISAECDLSAGCKDHPWALVQCPIGCLA
ncbi:MAG TPA: hypothetical protein VHA77_15570, partial [Xanthobacteraceae bacterium]|nr:hypothetical protein [Xanthobacteraceae bacterium]